MLLAEVCFATMRSLVLSYCKQPVSHAKACALDAEIAIRHRTVPSKVLGWPTLWDDI